MSLGQGDSGPPNLFVIREVYESDHSSEKFEIELETALQNRTPTIVIEPHQLGDETGRWITVGNCLHKTGVLAGLGSIISAFIWPDRPIIYLPLCSLSISSSLIYAVSWSGDPCCKYQVETDPKPLIPVLKQIHLNTSSPVVLVRRDDNRRKILHNLISLSALATAVFIFRRL